MLYVGCAVTARPMRQLMPPSLLRGRWIVVLVCYLDDSGKDPQNPATTLAGYAASDAQWTAFEEAVEPVFTKHRLGTLHTKDLHHTDGEFAGWSGAQKHQFVRDVCAVMADHIPFGMSVSVVKQQYAARSL